MGRYMFDCIVTKENDGYCVSFPQLPGCITDGDTRDEAVHNADEALRTYLADSLNRGEAVPTYERSAEVVSLSVELGEAETRRAVCRTFKEAAQDLKVTPSRVSALVKAGRLDVMLVEGKRMVTIESVERYAASERRAGRPKKFVALS